MKQKNVSLLLIILKINQCKTKRNAHEVDSYCPSAPKQIDVGNSEIKIHNNAVE
jgi:hypothetical protein